MAGRAPVYDFVPDCRFSSRWAASHARLVIADVAAGEDGLPDRDMFIALQACAHQYVSTQDESWRTAQRMLLDVLAQRHAGLVLFAAERASMRWGRRSTWLDMDELRSEMAERLLRCFLKFNPLRGFRFSTYFTRAALTAGWRLTGQMAQRQNRFNSQIDDRVMGLDETPVGMSLEVADLRRAMDGLTEVERAVVAYRFLSDRRPTLEETGRMIGKTKERARQIQQTALAKLREALDADSCAFGQTGRG